MRYLTTLFVAIFLMIFTEVFGQVSADCINAIPICNNTPANGGTNGFGIDDFNGASVSGCLEETITNAIESNSAWYRFRTMASGQLGFNIGIDKSDDWDFALYRSSDCGALGEPIRCNFFDNKDQDSFLGVGEDPTGNGINIQYEDWLEVNPGEDYYLLINNFSNTNSGFSVQFSGEIFVKNSFDALDCSIISNLLGPPISECEGNQITLDATTVDAMTYKWYKNIGIGFEPMVGKNSNELIVSNAATYRVEIIKPDGITIISDVRVGYSTTPSSFPTTDAVVCSDDEYFDLESKDIEVLGIQNNAEFVVSYYGSLADANSGSNVLQKLLPIPATSIPIYIRVASVENPDCYNVSQQFQLVRLETPALEFPSEEYLCSGTTDITIGLPTSEPFHTYSWATGETSSSLSVSQPGEYTLTVTNTQNSLSCVNSKTVSVFIANPPVISNIEIEDLQENNTVKIFTQEEGDWEYRLDEGTYQSSSEFKDVLPGAHRVTVNDLKGCGSVTEEIVVVGFPKFFTPNGDGKNDYWNLIEVSSLDSPEVFIYDRFGTLLQYLKGNSSGWDGTFSGKPLPESDYWFKLIYRDTNGEITEAKYINSHFSLNR